MVLGRVENQVRPSAADRAKGLADRERRPGRRRTTARALARLRAQGRYHGRADGLDETRFVRVTVRRLPVGGLRYLIGREEQDGTAVVLVAATWSREESERRPGRFFTLHHDHMGLDNYPIRCTCGKHKYQDGIPARFTHRPKDPCPLKREGQPNRVIARCCWLRGELAARELEALGNEDLPRLMRDNMSAEQAIDLSVALKTYADAQERAHRGTARKPKGAGWHGYWNNKRREWIWTSYSTFEEALASIREAALWFGKVGRLGFGVQAWN